MTNHEGGKVHHEDEQGNLIIAFVAFFYDLVVCEIKFMVYRQASRIRVLFQRNYENKFELSRLPNGTCLVLTHVPRPTSLASFLIIPWKTDR